MGLERRAERAPRGAQRGGPHTKGVGRGTGLGLSVSRNTVAAIGGEISVKSEPGHGTTFRVVLPPATHARAAALAPPSAVDDIETRRGVVLVVDEERSIGVLLGRVLTGHDVTIACSADEALGLIASGRAFDVILSDIMMPGKSGIELYAELEATSPEHSERVVFISGGAFSRAQTSSSKPCRTSGSTSRSRPASSGRWCVGT